jgi:hypothetical protein
MKEGGYKLYKKLCPILGHEKHYKNLRFINGCGPIGLRPAKNFH